MDIQKRVVAARLSAIAGLSLASLANASVVYSNNFESGSTSGWSIPRGSVTPTGRGFLGEFGNETPKLLLTNLGTHTGVTVAFDVYVIRSWDGNSDTPGVGPDVWSFGFDKPDGEQALITTTFACQPAQWSREQSYPTAFGFGDAQMYSGAAERDTLGYVHRDWELSAVYRMQFTFPHASNDLGLWFRGSGLQQITDESWGIDNITVTTIPTPGALALGGLSLGLLGRRSRR